MFPPDQLSTAYLYGDLVKGFLDKGYRVTVLTTTPHYNFNSKFESDKKYSLIWKKSNYFGSEVYHFPHTKSKNLGKRAINIAFFHLAFIIKSLFVKKPDVILTPSPPITSGFLSGLMGKLRGAKSIYNVQEIYPDILINHLNIRNNFLLGILKGLEKLTYKLNDKVVAIDEHFAHKIKDRLIKTKLEVIPNFIDTDLYSPYKGAIRSDYAFEGKYLVGYVGNLGDVQDWDCVIKAAKLLSDHTSIHFLFVGGGSKYNFLQLKSEELSNITVLPYQHRDNIPELNARIDLHFISMSTSSDYDGLPSKVFAILSSEKTILAATSDDSPLGHLLKKVGNSRVVARGDAKSFSSQILSLKQKPIPLLERAEAREQIVAKYSKKVVCEKYISLVESLNA